MARTGLRGGTGPALRSRSAGLPRRQPPGRGSSRAAPTTRRQVREIYDRADGRHDPWSVSRQETNRIARTALGCFRVLSGTRPSQARSAIRVERRHSSLRRRRECRAGEEAQGARETSTRHGSALALVSALRGAPRFLALLRSARVRVRHPRRGGNGYLARARAVEERDPCDRAKDAEDRADRASGPPVQRMVARTGRSHRTTP